MGVFNEEVQDLPQSQITDYLRYWDKQEQTQPKHIAKRLVKNSISKQRRPQAHSHAENMTPGLQRKVGNLTSFSPQTWSDDIKLAGPQHFLQDHMSAKQWLRSVCANAQTDQSHYFALISQTAKLSLDECWANMQPCRKCLASAEISEHISRLHFHKFTGYASGPWSSALSDLGLHWSHKSWSSFLFAGTESYWIMVNRNLKECLLHTKEWKSETQFY